MAPAAISVGLAVVVVIISAYTDLRRGKIYNAVTLPALGLGVLLNIAFGAMDGLLLSLSGVGMAFALWLLSVLCGGCMGGGDIKLLGAVGSLCGPRFLLTVLIATAFAGGLLAVAVAARHGQLWATIRRLVWWLTCRLGAHCPAPLSADDAGLRLPYALPIAAGVLVTCLLSAERVL